MLLSAAGAVFLLSRLALSQDTHPSYDHHPTARDKRQSLSFPIQQDQDHAYDAHGAAEASGDHIVTLSTDEPLSQGGLWAIEPNMHESWLFELGFTFPSWPAAGSRETFGTGLGIWYSRERPFEEVQDKVQSSFVGWRSRFQGLGVSVTPTLPESAASSKQAGDSLVSAHFNDGTQTYNNMVDLAAKGLGHCSRNLHKAGKGSVFYFRLSYFSPTGALNVEMSPPQSSMPVGSGRAYEHCFTSHVTAIDKGGYFGVTSWAGPGLSGGKGAAVSVLSIDVYAMTSQTKHSKEPPPVASREAQADDPHTNLQEARLHAEQNIGHSPDHDHRSQHGALSEVVEELRASQSHLIKEISEMIGRLDRIETSILRVDHYDELKITFERVENKISLLERRTEALAPLVQPDSPHLSRMTQDLSNLVRQLGQLQEGINQGHVATLSSHSTVLEQFKEGMESLSRKGPNLFGWFIWLIFAQIFLFVAYYGITKRMEDRRKKYL